MCIAEKPSVAKEIANILGATTRRNGYLEGNGYCVTWTFGHLCTLQEPGEYTEKWQRYETMDQCYSSITAQASVKQTADHTYTRER